MKEMLCKFCGYEWTYNPYLRKEVYHFFLKQSAMGLA